MEKIDWTNRVKYEVMQRVKEERIIEHTVRIRKANWIGHNLRRNCLLKHVIKERYKGGKDEEEDVSNYCITVRR
jgi:hypothetical protein